MARPLSFPKRARLLRRPEFTRVLARGEAFPGREALVRRTANRPGGGPSRALHPQGLRERRAAERLPAAGPGGIPVPASRSWVFRLSRLPAPPPGSPDPPGPHRGPPTDPNRASGPCRGQGGEGPGDPGPPPRADPPLPTPPLALAPSRLPVPPELLPVRPRGGRPTRRLEGGPARSRAPAPLPAGWRVRGGPGSLTGGGRCGGAGQPAGDPSGPSPARPTAAGPSQPGRAPGARARRAPGPARRT